MKYAFHPQQTDSENRFFDFAPSPIIKPTVTKGVPLENLSNAPRCMTFALPDMNLQH
jgi:hypothetical protein